MRPGLLAILVLSASLVEPRASSAQTAPGWVVLRISRAQVQPTKIDGAAWDPAQEPKGQSCGPIAVASKALGPAAAVAATLLCASSRSGERDVRAPDVLVQVSTGDAKYRTPVALNTYDEAFDYAVVVPLHGVPRAGLELAVLDQDTDVGAGELIGMVRITQAQLEEALAAPSPLLTVSDGQLSRLELEVTRYTPPAAIEGGVLDVRRELSALPLRARAGELVTIAAEGRYRVASDGEKIYESGYPDARKRGANLPEFRDANHGAVVARIGVEGESRANFLVGACAAAVAPVAGVIQLGINDTDRSNNEGSVRYSVQLSAPSVEQWRTAALAPCDQVPAEPAPAAAAAGARPSAGPRELDRRQIAAGMAKVRVEARRCGARSAAHGTVKVEVTVAPSGRVSRLAIRTFPDRALATCVATAVRAATFEPTERGGTFSYPFTF